jgi:ribonuclease P protein component
MLPKNKRVTKALFQKVMDTGGRINGSFFVLRYIRSAKPQFAFVAPKSVAKLAVRRNKLRRYGYNSLRSQPLLPYIGVFFYKKLPKEVSPEEIKKDIEEVLERLKKA